MPGNTGQLLKKKKINSLEMICPRKPKARKGKLLKIIRNRPHFISKINLVLTSVYVSLTRICLPVSFCKWWLSK